MKSKKDGDRSFSDGYKSGKAKADTFLLRFLDNYLRHPEPGWEPVKIWPGDLWKFVRDSGIEHEHQYTDCGSRGRLCRFCGLEEDKADGGGFDGWKLICGVCNNEFPDPKWMSFNLLAEDSRWEKADPDFPVPHHNQSHECPHCGFLWELVENQGAQIFVPYIRRKEVYLVTDAVGWVLNEVLAKFKEVHTDWNSFSPLYNEETCLKFREWLIGKNGGRRERTYD